MAIAEVATQQAAVQGISVYIQFMDRIIPSVCFTFYYNCVHFLI